MERMSATGNDGIHVSSLNALGSVAARLASFDLLTLLSPGHPETDWSGLACERHIRLAFHDVIEPLPGLVAPDRDVMQAILNFGRAGSNQRAMLIHCWAGISRSSAAAFAIACDRNPGFEREIAAELRRRAPSVTPNRRAATPGEFARCGSTPSGGAISGAGGAVSMGLRFSR